MERFREAPTAPLPSPAQDPCSAYAYEGAVYDCGALDRCDVSRENIPYRLACCECDAALCDPDPACGDGGGGDDDDDDPGLGESCEACHNGADNYQGPGIENPHPFGVGLTAYLNCTMCHGGDPNAPLAEDAHVPPPPEIGDEKQRAADPAAWWWYRTTTGVERFPDYVGADGSTYTALDWLQFVNPGDLRVVTASRGCGQIGCHGGEHTELVDRSPMTTAAGLFSGAMFTVGSAGLVAESAALGLYGDTASDRGTRDLVDPAWQYEFDVVGTVPELVALAERAVWGDPTGFDDNPAFAADAVAAGRYVDEGDGHHVNQVVAGSPLEQVVSETVIAQCGACHAGSRGANDQAGSYRSAGCSACHMPYALDGRSSSADPNIDPSEPADPDALVAPERPHVAIHRLRSFARVLPDGTFVPGVEDETCGTCHQGSNLTVLQYWGVRPDPGRDVARGAQYPANPASFTTAAGDPRLFDGNATWAGREPDQLLVTEDYDGDGRDDTPPDVHYEAGMGCVDCHGSRDVHGGTDGAPDFGRLWSRMGDAVGVRCESCHGTADAPPATTQCLDYFGQSRECPTDRFGEPLRNVTRDSYGSFWLQSRVNGGGTRYVPLLRDVIVDTGVLHPTTGQPVYDPAASYAMGRADGDPATGTGPLQTALTVNGFSHLDTLSCDACHAAWQNNCVGCHLELTYDDDPDHWRFSNTTGERIVVQGTRADLTYGLPTWSLLAVTRDGRIGAAPVGIKPYWAWRDADGAAVEGLVFSDRNGAGFNPGYGGASPLPALSHNRIAPHTIRGRATATEEGARGCVACHLDADGMATWGVGYAVYHAQIEARDYAGLDYALLAEHLGRNTNNQLGSPYYVHMVAGLGTGLLAADARGCPTNPWDTEPGRPGCDGVAPADAFDRDAIAADWDKVTEAAGVGNVSLAQALRDPLAGGALRGDGQDEASSLAGPLSAELLTRLADPTLGLVLDSWLDADGVPHGGAIVLVPAP